MIKKPLSSKEKAEVIEDLQQGALQLTWLYEKYFELEKRIMALECINAELEELLDE